jgi:hypothetical protein
MHTHETPPIRIDSSTAVTIFGESQPKRPRNNQRADNVPCPKRKKVAEIVATENLSEYLKLEEIHRIRNFPQTKHAKL